MTEKQKYAKDLAKEVDDLCRKIIANCNSLKLNVKIPVDLQISICQIHIIVNELSEKGINPMLLIFDKMENK